MYVLTYTDDNVHESVDAFPLTAIQRLTIHKKDFCITVYVGGTPCVIGLDKEMFLVTVNKLQRALAPYGLLGSLTN
jgi:hypothetical protein